MKYWKSYLVSEEDVEKLPVEAVEDMMWRAYEDCYLTPEDKMEILEVYIKCRWHLKQKSFVYNEANLKRIAATNGLLIKQTTEAVELAREIYLQESEENKKSPRPYDLEVFPQLLVPVDMYHRYGEEAYRGNFTERDERIWQVLNSPYNKQKNYYNVLNCNSFYYNSVDGTDWKNAKEMERCVEDMLWGETLKDEDPGKKSWGCVMNIDREKTAGICFCWPFHTLLDFCGLCMEDILKIERFDMEVEVNYER